MKHRERKDADPRRIHIYTGEGKGKTTSAIGLAMRAAGGGYKVCIFQFLKGGGEASGELGALKKLKNDISFVRFEEVHPMFGRGKVSKASLKKRIKDDCNVVKSRIRSGRYDVVILDEIINALSEGFMSMRDIAGIIRIKPAGTELILTGRQAPQRLIDIADYVTEMKSVKHPFRHGVQARKGIEY